MDKLLIICGPTATGKTDLGIKLAKRFNGEIISADSRQVYIGMDIGTGKDIDNKSKFIIQNSNLQFNNKKMQIGYRKKNGIPIWLVDVVKPDYRFNVGEYKKLADLVIRNIRQRGKLPVIVGGTGLYIKALSMQLTQVNIPPNKSLREKLEILSVSKLQNMLHRLNPSRLYRMNHSDKSNSRRLIRAIEIEKWLRKNSWTQTILNEKPESLDIYNIGLTASRKLLNKHIAIRIRKRIKLGIIREVSKLIKMDYSWDLPAMSTLGYKQWRLYFDKKQARTDIISRWILEEQQYAKRQLTWFDKIPNIYRFDVEDKKTTNEIIHKVSKWYNN